MAKNNTLNKAKKEKNDEFYTRYEDIQSELNHYTKHFENMTVLCNCDDPFESNFCKFFLRNFNYLKLKRLICTSFYTSPIVATKISLFDEDNKPLKKGNGYVMDVDNIPMANGRGVSDDDIRNLLHSKGVVRKLKGDGDFRSEECIAYLKQADIIVTNPPFSLFRTYVGQLIEYDKKFLIIGNPNALKYKEIFPLFMANRIWLGFKSLGTDMYFDVSNDYKWWLVENKKEGSGYKVVDGDVRGRVSACWFTNLDIQKRHEKMLLYRKYQPSEYMKFANYNAINVDKLSDIPCDFNGIMGVPITFMEKFNPNQFEIIGRTGNLEWAKTCGFFTPPSLEEQSIFKKQNKTWRVQNGYFVDEDGIAHTCYDRIFIRKKENVN